jgi:hypothetical protein
MKDYKSITIDITLILLIFCINNLLPFNNFIDSLIDKNVSNYFNYLIFSFVIFSLFYQISNSIIPFFLNTTKKSRYKKSKRSALQNNKLIDLSVHSAVFMVASIVTLFACFIVLTVISFKLYPFPAIMIFITAIIFAISTSIEVIFETNKLDSGIERKLRSWFDNSIKYWFPPFLLTIAIIAPLDIIIEPIMNYSLLVTRILFYICIPLILYKISIFLSNKIFYKFEIQNKINKTTLFSQFVLPILTTLFIQIWELNISNNFINNDHSIGNIILLIISGILPLRIINLFMPKKKIYERIITLVAIAIYICNKFNLLTFVSIA